MPYPQPYSQRVVPLGGAGARWGVAVPPVFLSEFHVQVERLMISSPQNYHFGDNVNMYGGSGNVGITHA